MLLRLGSRAATYALTVVVSGAATYIAWMLAIIWSK